MVRHVSQFYIPCGRYLTDGFFDGVTVEWRSFAAQYATNVASIGVHIWLLLQVSLLDGPMDHRSSIWNGLPANQMMLTVASCAVKCTSICGLAFGTITCVTTIFTIEVSSARLWRVFRRWVNPFQLINNFFAEFVHIMLFAHHSRCHYKQ